MSVLKALYGTANQLITITLNSLGAGVYRQSVSVDNSSNLFLDVEVTVKAKGAPANSTGTLQVFAYASTDGTTFDGSCTGTDTTYSPPVIPPNLAYLGTLNLNNSVTGTVIDQRTFSLAQAFGGNVPTKWGIVIYNNTGASLDASAGGSVWYQGIQAQTV